MGVYSVYCRTLLNETVTTHCVNDSIWRGDMACMGHTQDAGVSILRVAGSSLYRLASMTSWMVRLERSWPRIGSVGGGQGLAVWSVIAEHKRRRIGHSHSIVTWSLVVGHLQDTLDPGRAHSGVEISSPTAGVRARALRRSTIWTETWLIATTRNFTFPIWRPDIPRLIVDRVPLTTLHLVDIRHPMIVLGLDITDMTTTKRPPQYPTPACHPFLQDTAPEWPNESTSPRYLQILPNSLEESEHIERK